VRASALFDTIAAGPYTGLSGSLSDGQTYSYLVRDSSGALADVTIDNDRANDRVVVAFTDL